MNQRWHGDTIRWEAMKNKKPDLNPIRPTYLDEIFFLIEPRDTPLFIMAYELTDSRVLFLLQKLVLQK